jgi:hypothetical protein
VLRDVGRGRPLTARGVTQALARNTSHILRHPHRRRHAIHHNHRIARYGRGAIASPVAGGVARRLGTMVAGRGLIPAGGAPAGGMTPVYGRGGMVPYRRGRGGALRTLRARRRPFVLLLLLIGLWFEERQYRPFGTLSAQVALNTRNEEFSNNPESATDGSNSQSP